MIKKLIRLVSLLLLAFFQFDCNLVTASTSSWEPNIKITDLTATESQKNDPSGNAEVANNIVSVRNGKLNVLDEWGLSHILSFCISDSKCRGVNKSFRRIFDKECEFYLTDMDSRFERLFLSIRKEKNKNLTVKKYIFSTKIPTLPVQVPLAYLFSNFLHSDYILHLSNLKEYFPIKPLISNKTQDLHDSIDIFLYLMTIYNHSSLPATFLTNDNNYMFDPIKFLLYYRTIQLILPVLRLKNFPKQIQFPFTVLLQIASMGHFSIEESKEIIRNYYNLSSSISPDFRPMFLALRKNQIEAVNFILDTFPQTINDFDSERQQLIHFAANLGNLQLFNKLIELGANPGASSKTSSVIRIAAASGHISIVERVIQLKSGIVASSAIDEAIINNHVDIARLIITHPDLYFVTWNLLSIAASNSNAGMIEFLLRTEANIDRSRAEIEQAIRIARLRNPPSPEIVHLLENYLTLNFKK